MRAFIDTSSLFKKYMEEDGSPELELTLKDVSEIVISPLTALEMQSVIQRKLRDNTLRPEDAAWIEREFAIDCDYFGVVSWNDEVVRTGLRLLKKGHLRTLDSIQLSSAILSKPGIFITSDRKLADAAAGESLTVAFI